MFAPFLNKNRKQKPTYSPISISKWMDGFELMMDEERIN